MRPSLAFLIAVTASAQTVEQRYAEARKNPGELYQFLLRMPKGGDLHNHLSGAVYAESYLRIAAQDGLCIDLKTYAIVAGPCGENRIEASRAETDNSLRNHVIDSLSMRGFVPGPESGHDHFFAAFNKFGPIKPEHRGEFVAEVVRRAAEQNETYLELMAINGTLANSIAGQMGPLGDFDAAKESLMRGGLAQVVEQMRSRIAEMDQGRRRALGCDSKREPPACRIVVHYLYE